MSQPVFRNEEPSFVDGLNGAIKDNPLAAGLIGLGVAWMFVGGRRMGKVVRPIPRLAKSATSGVGSAASSGMQSLRDGASATLAVAGSASESVRSSAEEWASTVMPDRQQREQTYPHPEQHADRPSFSQSLSTDFGNFRDKTQDAFEQQPLLMGVAGLALGAAIAGAFRTTQMEQEILGSHAAGLKQQAEDALADAKLRASRAAEAMQEEAAAQGLSVDGAREQIKAATQRVANVARSSTGLAPE